MNTLPIIQTGDTYKIVFHVDSMKARPNYRLAIIRFKETKNADGSKKKAPAARSVEIPDIRIAVNPACLSDALTASFQEYQDAIIRQHIEGLQDGSLAPTETSIKWEQINEQAVSDYFLANAASGKLSKDAIATWFDDSLAEILGMAVVEAKPNFSEAELATTLDAYKKQICGLASPRSSYPEQLAKQLRKAVAMAPSSKVQESLINKLDMHLKPKEEVSLLDL